MSVCVCAHEISTIPVTGVVFGSRTSGFLFNVPERAVGIRLILISQQCLFKQVIKPSM